MDHEHGAMEEDLGAEPMAALDDGRRPHPRLEDRVVAELRRRSLLRAAGEPATAAPRRSALRRASPWLVGAAAASLAFALGLRAGAERSLEPPSPPVVAVADSTEVAARIRSAAFDYVSALSAVRPADAEARSAAIATFRTAADHIIRLAPESNLAVAIGLAYPTSFVASPATEAAVTRAQRVIWF